MRVCSKLRNVSIFIFCVFLSVLYIIFRSNQLLIESNPLKTDFNYYQNSINSDNSGPRLWTNSYSKWKVLNDGTVVHLGNTSETYFNNISFVINNKNICENFLITRNAIKVLIFIESEINNFERRQTIRDTWAQTALQESLNFKIVYLIGLHPNKALGLEVQERIGNENQMFGDLIQINVKEDFKNLTFKSIASIKWFLDYCPKADLYFKTDDDILIHPNNLIESLKQFAINNYNNNSILCHENKSRKIVRTFEKISQIMRSYRHSVNRFEIIEELKKKLLKYKINYSQLPGTYFPHYCSGFGYGFSAPVAQLLYNTALTIPYFMIEDVFITGFCRQKANIDIKESKQLTLRPVLQPSEGICGFNSGRINANEMSNQDIRQLWIYINTKGFKCNTKTQ